MYNILYHILYDKLVIIVVWWWMLNILNDIIVFFQHFSYEIREGSKDYAELFISLFVLLFVYFTSYYSFVGFYPLIYYLFVLFNCIVYFLFIYFSTYLSNHLFVYIICSLDIKTNMIYNQITSTENPRKIL